MNDDIRKLFPITERYTYLDHASVAPVSTDVIDGMNWFLRDVQSGGPVNFPQWMKRMHEVKEMVGRLINGRAAQIAFVASTSEGVSIIANG
ncbi:MAG TPA: aminotransferase class V-fold PLP-dependent enzyme, partial [Blastocatellia bacterium]|nr:aminotransferase class V-fold PLP-dependent enzyme [Blastocatellia bacterium]